MYRPTDRQVPLLSAGVGLPEEARERLRSSWAGPFQEHVLPVLLVCEDDFAALYSSGRGRPSWSIARRLGICLLQEMFDLTDQRALDAVSFDARWQYALGMAPGEAYLSRRSLVDFRSRMVRADPEMRLLRRVFERLRDAQLEDLKVRTELQRMDSTFVVSNIRKRGRTGLFSQTLEVFVRDLQRHRAEAFAQLSEPLRAWAEARAKKRDWFGDHGSASPLQQLAEWLVEAWQAFADDEDVSSWESYELVARLVEEQLKLVPSGPDDCEGEGDGDGDEEPRSAHEPVEVVVRRKPQNNGTSLQTPHDPDATYGRKGTGYSVQVVETCHNEDQPEVITDFEVTGANENDWRKTTPALERLRGDNHLPDTLFVDGGYPSGPALLDARALGVDLHGPAPRLRLPKDAVGRDEFEYDDEGQIVACPQGHAPIREGHRRIQHVDEPVRHVYFDRKVCAACPLVERCVTRAGKTSHRRLEDRPSLRARDEALARQRDPAWWKTYSIRAGIEATNSELKRAHGLGKLRVRRGPRVRLAVTNKITACNTKRWLRSRQRASRRG